MKTMSTYVTWDVGLWCNLCGKTIGKLADVVSPQFKPVAGDLPLREVGVQMREHEEREHPAATGVNTGRTR